MTEHDCDCVPGHRCDCWDYRAAPSAPAGLTPEDVANILADYGFGYVEKDSRIALIPTAADVRKMLRNKGNDIRVQRLAVALAAPSVPAEGLREAYNAARETLCKRLVDEPTFYPTAVLAEFWPVLLAALASDPARPSDLAEGIRRVKEMERRGYNPPHAGLVVNDPDAGL